MENTEENCEKIWKIWGKKREKIWNTQKKDKLNSEKLGKIWKKPKLNSEKLWKIQKKSKLNSEMIWKMCKMIVKEMENTEEK
jgi:dephospho-CoA kinase